ncbi:hypothetical protein GGI07_004661 [Coemansia sp. Benny D115]|nr:hypothetical protein GGI07_004661 [Coemansia sp. Benny D115]
MSYSTLSLTDSTVSSTPTLRLDSLQTHHTQALVNVVSSSLYDTPLPTHTLASALFELRRHLESPLSFAHSHPATETNAAQVLEHILLCWVCARAAQADMQNYAPQKTIPTADALFDKYADISADAVSEAIQCTSYLATMGPGIGAVARTSIPASLVLVLGFSDTHGVLTSALRTLTKLCTKHSIKRARAGARWEAETGLYAVMDAFTRGKEALQLRCRFDTLANTAFQYVSEVAAAPRQKTTALRPQSSLSSLDNYSRCISAASSYVSFTHESVQVVQAERVVASALALVNALIEAHSERESRLRLRKELLDTALYKCIKILEEPELDDTRAYEEARKFRRAYARDIKDCDTQTNLPSPSSQ